MRRRRFIAVAATVVAATATTQLVSPGLASAGTSNPYGPDVVVARAAAGKRAYFPGLTKLADGKLVAAYREGADHIGQDGRFLVTESTDNGHLVHAAGGCRVAVRRA